MLCFPCITSFVCPFLFLQHLILACCPSQSNRHLVEQQDARMGWLVGNMPPTVRFVRWVA